MIDEDPSPEDVERFEGETAACPECGAQMWDQADVCPECGAFVDPGHGSLRRRWVIATAVVTAAALAWAVLRWL